MILTFIPLDLLRADHEKKYLVNLILFCASDIFGTETSGELRLPPPAPRPKKKNSFEGLRLPLAPPRMTMQCYELLVFSVTQFKID